jgi:hypothetical protein
VPATPGKRPRTKDDDDDDEEEEEEEEKRVRRDALPTATKNGLAALVDDT